MLHPSVSSLSKRNVIQLQVPESSQSTEDTPEVTHKAVMKLVDAINKTTNIKTNDVSASPAKKGRGRKHKAQQENLISSVIAETGRKVVIPDDKPQDESASPPKKRRGRKAKIQEENLSETPKAKSGRVAVVANTKDIPNDKPHDKSASPPKKGRGQRAKIQREIPEETPKLTRGRKRKNGDIDETKPGSSSDLQLKVVRTENKDNETGKDFDNDLNVPQVGSAVVNNEENLNIPKTRTRKNIKGSPAKEDQSQDVDKVIPVKRSSRKKILEETEQVEPPPKRTRTRKNIEIKNEIEEPKELNTVTRSKRARK